MKSWVARIQEAQAELEAQDADPWRLRLDRLRGKVGHVGVERVSSQGLFDLLEVPMRARTAGAYRRLAKLMRELGWAPIRLRDRTYGGYLEQIRGYSRGVGSGSN
jgi:hypothetical protein